MTVDRLLSSTKNLQSRFLTAPILRLYNFDQTAFHLDSSFICWFWVITVPFSISGVSSFLPGMPKNQETVDKESS